VSSEPAARFRLAPAPPPAPAPELDDAQRSVVAHPGGPLLVLAGPGTGKTTTLVEAIVDRVERRGTHPDAVLALTFSRKAAEQLRDRVSARLGRTTGGMMTATFHSFAYALVRRYSAPDLYTEPLRLLSAPEQDVIVRGLLDGPGAVAWPPGLRAAVGTRGFARELGELMARTTERGLGSRRLREVGTELDRSDLRAAADFMDQYDRVLGDLNALDYSTLIADAVAMLQDPGHPARDELRSRFDAVFVDEYQDTDPSQVALLQAIAGDGRDLVVVGDPHQSIYAFRGADVRGILDFPSQFPAATGEPAGVIVLRSTRRFGPRILAGSQRIAHRIGMPGSIAADHRAAFASPVVADPGATDSVEVLTFDTERAEIEGVADLLRRAHLEDEVPWSEMAVLVRSGRSAIPTLRRSLVASGVPVEVSADETPLVQEPAVLPLLAAARAVADPTAIDAEGAHALLISPLCGLDVTEVRTLARALRSRDHDDGVVRPSGEALLEAVRDPDATVGIDLPAATRAGGLARLLRAGRDALSAGATAEEVLWALWSGTRWPERLRTATERGGSAARYAHRDLDAIVALFETAARAEEQAGHTGMAAFLDSLGAQQIPADTLADRGVRGEAVRLLTAHRSKGLEWTLVVATHVQEGTWPDLRTRSSLLDADRITHDGLADKTTARQLLAEERRLFYVACTRARRRLVVTAVASADDDGDQPSRFLADLAGDSLEITHRQGRPPRSLSLSGLVADLRRTLADEAEPDSVRDAAARRLRRLAGLTLEGRALVPAADPVSWWGTLSPTAATAPVRPDGEPVRLTASALTGIGECPARWFLEREAGGARASTQGQGFGNVVHALADRIGTGALGAGEDDDVVVEEAMAHLDEVWAQIPFRTPWSASRERAEAEAAIRRFVAWDRRADARTVIATEQRLAASVTLPDGQEVRIEGYADRLEIDDRGRVVVIDLKTGKYPPANTDLPTNPQLGLYQLAVEQGGLDLDALAERAGVPVPDPVPGGAELWQLRHETRAQLKVQAQEPLEAAGERVVEEQLAAAVAIIRSEEFPTRPGSHCERCDFALMCPAQQAATVLS